MSARAIVVEGVEIPEALIAQEAQNHPSLSAQEAWRAAGSALAVKALLLRRAEELGLQAQPEFDELGREETRDEALVRQVLDAEVEVVPPTEAEMRRFYQANASRFVTPALYEASHILIAPREADSESDEAARWLAAGVIQEVADGAARFEDLARSLSQCASAALDGSLGQLRPGDLVPEVERVLLQLAPGEVASLPVRSRHGWHVLRLDRRIDGRQLPFEPVAERIRLHLESRAWVSAAARYTADLAEHARMSGVALRLTREGGVGTGSLALGDLLTDEAAGRVEPWLQASDAALAERVAQAAAAAGETVAEFVQLSVAAFVAEANDERWTQLISATQDSQDPALAAISQILRSKLIPAKRRFTLIRRV
ncbi:MAG TPA: peptidylprolyl isomerase [Phenylobacterium sp.]